MATVLKSAAKTGEQFAQNSEQQQMNEVNE